MQAMKRIADESFHADRQGPPLSMSDLTIFHIFEHLVEPATKEKVETVSKALLAAGQTRVVKAPRVRKETRARKGAAKASEKEEEEDKSLARLFV